MSQLPTNRTASNSASDHVNDHNELARLHNIFDGSTPGGSGGGFDTWTVVAAAGGSHTFSGDATNLARYIATLDQATCAVTISLSNDQQVDLQLIQGSGGGKAVTWIGIDQWATITGSAPSALIATPAASDRLYFERINGITYGYWLTEPVLGSASSPWILPLDGYCFTASSTTFPSVAVNPLYIGNYAQDYTGTQGDWLAWDIVLAPGTWAVQVVYRQSASSGILSFQINDVEVVAVDGYNSSLTESVVTKTSTFSVATLGKIRFKCVMSTKNVSSGGYAGRISRLTLLRTA